MEKDQQKSIKLFFCYSHKDKALREQLENHLGNLKRSHWISHWYDGELQPGAEWEREIALHLSTSNVILLLISPDFMASDFCYGIEMKQALERHEKGDAYVIPILLRPVYWKDAPFAKLQVLPTGSKPLTQWANRDEAFVDVVSGIRLIYEEILKHSASLPTSEDTPNIFNPPPSQAYDLYHVFVKSGFPHVTFVEREDFELLKLSLAQPGRGVVIEGPSGIGKTTAVKKAIDELRSRRLLRRELEKNVSLSLLSARNPEHRDLLETLPNWHSGTVIIDDFHRLDALIRKKIVDYLKYLADTEPESKKLVIIGVPQSGQTLVDTSFDVTTRIDVFSWGTVKDELILHMIEKGEKALNIEFDRRAEIILAASGSFNIAQFLCFNICQKEGILETQNQMQAIQCNVNTAVSFVMTDLSRKFGESIRRFSAMGGHRDITSLRLLEELARSDNGFLSLPLLKDRKRDLAQGIDRFINEKWMSKLCIEYPECMNHIFFEQTVQSLIIDDPQLTFYLNKVQFSGIAKEAGKVVALVRRKVFISYSHRDTEYLERLRIHLKPLEREGIIDLWDDTKISAGMEWREEIQNALESSIVAVVLVSADFLASDFIAEHELPKILQRAGSGGTTILPLIVAPCLFAGSGVDVFQTVNPPDKPLTEMTPSERERTLVKLAETISKKLTI